VFVYDVRRVLVLLAAGKRINRVPLFGVSGQFLDNFPAKNACVLLLMNAVFGGVEKVVRYKYLPVAPTTIADAIMKVVVLHKFSCMFSVCLTTGLHSITNRTS
jgi:hypothetical protein